MAAPNQKIEAHPEPYRDEMEEQHEVLLALVARLAVRDAAHALKAELSLLLHELINHTDRHFKDEEAYMQATGYDKLDTHQMIHRELLVTLRRHVSAFEDGDGRLGVKLTSFLKFWLAPHINNVDRQPAAPGAASTFDTSRAPLGAGISREVNVLQLGRRPSRDRPDGR